MNFAQHVHRCRVVLRDAGFRHMRNDVVRVDQAVFVVVERLEQLADVAHLILVDVIEKHHHEKAKFGPLDM